MTDMTARDHSDRIVFCRKQIEMIENIQIPDLQEAARCCKQEGRYITASGYYWLIQDLRRDVEAYRRSVDFHLGEIAKSTTKKTAIG